MKDKLRSYLDKIKQNRKIQIAIALTLIILLIGGYFIFTKLSAKEDSPPSNAEMSEAEQYAASLETKLENVLSSVKGAGKVKVLVTLGSGFEYVYATEQTSKETSSGIVTTTEVVLVGGKPVITQTIYPTINGVLVSASGANDFSVKLNLISAIQTVVDVANEDITILTSN